MAITITGITPANAPTTGGTVHYITGTDLTTVTGVTIGGTAAEFEAKSATLMVVIAPPHAVGAVAVVLNPGAVTLAAGLTYAVPTGDEQLVSTGAGKWVLEVNSGTVAVPVWTKVRGMAEFKPESDPNMEDDTDYDSEGYASETKTLIKWGAEAKVLRKKGESSGNYDPGQEVLRLASDKFGAPGTPQIRYYDRTGGPEAFQGFVSVVWKPEGGAVKDLDAVTVTMSGNGKRTPIINPAA